MFLFIKSMSFFLRPLLLLKPALAHNNNETFRKKVSKCVGLPNQAVLECLQVHYTHITLAAEPKSLAS